MTFTIDPAGTGRGTLSFTDVTKNQPFMFVFYMASPTQGFIQDNSANVVGEARSPRSAGRSRRHRWQEISRSTGAE